MININWDTFGISAALICAIHCAVLPFFITSLPYFLGSFFKNEWFEAGMIFISFCIGVSQFYFGIKKHNHSLLPLILFTIGIGIVFTKFLLENDEIILISFGAFFIILAHSLNFIICKRSLKKGTHTHHQPSNATHNHDSDCGCQNN